MKSPAEKIDWQKNDGLVPAIVQHALSGRVLMLGYMNDAALAKTLASKLVTFYSRSRNQLWTKGEVSGNRLELHDIQIDCDGDTLLVQATPTGSTCHLDRASCFDGDAAQPGFGFIGRLETVIGDRMHHAPADSYTAQLMNSGERRIAQKIGEEGVELAVAATARDRRQIIAEAADLIYHVLVLLHQQRMKFSDVVDQLASRNRD